MTSPRSTASESLKFQKEVTEYALRGGSQGYGPEHCLQLKGVSALLCEQGPQSAHTDGHITVNISRKWGQLDSLTSFSREKSTLQRIRNRPGFRCFMRSRTTGSALKILKEQDFQLWILYSTKLSPKQQVEKRHFQVNENLNNNKNS